MILPTGTFSFGVFLFSFGIFLGCNGSALSFRVIQYFLERENSDLGIAEIGKIYIILLVRRKADIIKRQRLDAANLAGGMCAMKKTFANNTPGNLASGGFRPVAFYRGDGY